MLKLLLRLGAPIDEQAEDETPFLHCWKNRRFKAARLLVANGANVNFQDSRGRTALHFAPTVSHPLRRVARSSRSRRPYRARQSRAQARPAVCPRAAGQLMSGKAAALGSNSAHLAGM